MTMSMAHNPWEAPAVGDCEYCEERDGEAVLVKIDGRLQRRVVCRECLDNAKGNLG